MGNNIKYRSAIICVAKDEDYYIDEWIEYHLKMGFDSIYIIQNQWKYSGTFQHDTRIHLAYESSGFSITSQVIWYRRILDQIRDKYDFIGIWDIDEFLVIFNNMSLQGFFERNKDKNVMFIPWRIFGDSHLMEFNESNTSVLKRFLLCDKELHSNGKSILNTTLKSPDIQLVTAHNFENSSTHEKIKTRAQDAELFHYRNKTRIERQQRMCGKGNFDKFFEIYNKNDVVNTLARDFLYKPSDIFKN